MSDLIPAARIFRDTPFSAASRVGLNDYFTGDGIWTTETVVNKQGFQIGESVQSKDTFWRRATGSLTVDGDDFTLESPPDLDAVVIVPHADNLPIRAYDQATVEGDPSPRVKQYPFYIGPREIADIVDFKFTASPGNPGILFQIVDKDTGYGAALTWLEVALALPDGTPDTYQSATLPLYFNSFENYDTLQSGVGIGATSLTVDDGTLFNEGDYLVLEPDTPNEDEIKCTAILGDVLTVSPTAFAHLAGATVFQIGSKGWIRTNIPLNASGGVPINLNELSPKLIATAESRL